MTRFLSAFHRFWGSGVRSIRPFQNTDTLSLSKIWEAHHKAYGSKSQCLPFVFDQCVLSKPYFRYSELQLAIDEVSGEASGWIHFGRNPEAKGIGHDSLIIHRLCVVPGDDESLIASQLLEVAMREGRSNEQTHCCGLGAFDESIYYHGVAEGDGLLGVDSNDVRLHAWMRQAGFEPYRATECRELVVSRFRPPMDRVQMGIHRTSTVSRIIEQDRPNWWENVIFGHCERIVYQLTCGAPNRAELQLTVWYPEMSLPGIDPGIARLTLPTIEDNDLRTEQWVYLISESLRQLQLERKQVVHVVIDPQDAIHSRILHRLGFKTKLHGMLLRR